jgi:hypothetical protein
MAPMKKKAGDDGVISLPDVSMASVEFRLLGAMPFCSNRLPEKARHELLMPAPKKNAAERASRLKHVPYEEFVASTYRFQDNRQPTRLYFPGAAWRKAIASAALDVPGSSKAQIGRLVRIEEYNVCIYGRPQIYAAIVRQADIKRTPDVRTRAILPEWACIINVRFATPILSAGPVANLLKQAGEFIGVGDGRNEKGTLSFGCFTIVNDPDSTDPRIVEQNAIFNRIVEEQGRVAQDAALADPEPYDAETEELLGWFDEELSRRKAGHPAHSGGDSGNGRAKAKAAAKVNKPKGREAKATATAS